MKNSGAGSILVTGMKSRKKENLIEGFTEIYNTLKKVGINPVLRQIDDNKYSQELID